MKTSHRITGVLERRLRPSKHDLHEQRGKILFTKSAEVFEDLGARKILQVCLLHLVLHDFPPQDETFYTLRSCPAFEIPYVLWLEAGELAAKSDERSENSVRRGHESRVIETVRIV